MRRLLSLLLCCSFIGSSFADEKQYSKEEIREMVEEAMSTKSRYGVDLSLGYDPDYLPERTHPSDMSVVSKRGKSRFIPFDPSSSDLWKLAAASTAAVIVFANDAEVMDFVQNNKSHISEKVAFFGEGFGSEWPMYAAAGGYILGVITKNDGTKRYALMGAKTMIISGIAVQALKNVFHRSRPKSENDPYSFDGLNGSFGNNISFPSGHTTLAFSAATYIAETNKHRGPLIPILAYSLAAVSAWSRVHDKAHWASDVIAGAALGHLVTRSVLNASTADKGFLITPMTDFHGNVFVSITYTGRPKTNVGDCEEGLDDERDKIKSCVEAIFRSVN